MTNLFSVMTYKDTEKISQFRNINTLIAMDKGFASSIWTLHPENHQQITAPFHHLRMRWRRRMQPWKTMEPLTAYS